LEQLKTKIEDEGEDAVEGYTFAIEKKWHIDSIAIALLSPKT
tara:strand:+ start:1512 stop:1637 length:126 start_codon:yes stop_codon:yes gene_type:complete